MTKKIKRVDKKAEGHPSLALDMKHDGTLTLEMLGDWKPIARAGGNIAVAKGLATQAANLGSQSQSVDEEAANFVLGYVDAMKPRDSAEVLLLSQMATTHQMLMMLARRANLVDTLSQAEAADRAFNKTARTFTAQMDTLKRYRSKGKQTVRVERVTVESGAQAVVGNVDHGGEGQ